MEAKFEWDAAKDLANRVKHGVSFETATLAFSDTDFMIREDAEHSGDEVRYHCYGKVDGKVLTVTFTYRGQRIRIISAGYWRYGRKQYETKNSLHGRA